MLDGSKYGRFFPDECQTKRMPVRSASDDSLAPTWLLLAALSRLEREFSEILRAQEAENSE